jgi:CRP/FNR family nitrogen fixation transcriptional regulator
LKNKVAFLNFFCRLMRWCRVPIGPAVQPAEYWYRVASGTARRCVAQPDGRRQIVELLLPGDFFGFTALNEYDSTVEAVADDTIVASYPRRRVEMLAEADPQLSREIRQVAFEALSRLQAQLMILGRIHRNREGQLVPSQDGGAPV